VTTLYVAEMAAESTGWHEMSRLVRQLGSTERFLAGYYHDPDWSVRDVVAHLGTWLAEADLQFQRIQAGTYEPHPVDVDGLNAALLRAMHDQPWDVVWTQANSARTMMLTNWTRLTSETPEAGWWIEKSGANHYGQHLPRLREWVADLAGRRR
jgi:hypothetical protein